MARALITMGPADGDSLAVDGNPPVLYFAPALRRSKADWVELERYVWVPPQDRAKRIYRHTGRESRKGPIEGMKNAPNWSL